MLILEDSLFTQFAPVIENDAHRDLYWQKYGHFHLQDPLLRHSLDHWQGVVLFLLLGDSLVLIKRSENLKSYRGQMALIGGKREKDEHDMMSVAKREFAEETGLSSDFLQVKGLLPLVYSARAHLIAPLVAEISLSEEQFSQQVESNGEWEYILSVPLHTLVNEENWVFALNRGHQDHLHTLLFRPLLSHEIHLLKGPPAPPPTSSFTHPHYGERPSFLLWGATARMVWNFLQIIKKAG